MLVLKDIAAMVKVSDRRQDVDQFEY